MVIELALAVWLGAQPVSAASPANLSDIARHLPELDETAASEELGLRDLYYSVRWAAADLWLRPEMIDPEEASWGFYSAEHAYMRDPTRAVALSWQYAEDGPDRTVLTFIGNHGSIPGDWIESFEALTDDCWRPDHTLHAQG